MSLEPSDTGNGGPILWLDDDPLRTERFRSALPEGTAVETAAAMVALLQALGPAAPARAVFLDHDLGGEVFVDSDRADTGMEVVRWIEFHKPPVERFLVQSFNTKAAKQMVERLEGAGYRAEHAPFGGALFYEALESLAFGD